MHSSSIFSLAFLSLAALAKAGTVEYNWDITWVWAAPDGFGRPVIGVNGKWPCPKIEATVGDTVIVKINNLLGNQTTGIHFHGINQISTPDMDGPSGVTQCPVPPGSSVKYQWVADTAGTYWCMFIESRIFSSLYGNLGLTINDRSLSQHGTISRWAARPSYCPRYQRPLR